MRRVVLVLALLVLAAIITGVAASATKTAIPQHLIGTWRIINGGPSGVMVVGPRGNVNRSKGDTSKAGWYHTKFSHVTAHRLSISGPRSCAGTGTYRWGISRHVSLGASGYRLTFRKIHDACKLRVNLFTLPSGDEWGRPIRAG